MKSSLLLATIALLSASESRAFCGFYVAKADASLFNERSEVILVRDGDRTVITMSNDFKGDVNDFAIVVPVPVVLERDDIQVVDRGIFAKLDGYSSPRLVEYYDENPCQRREYMYDGLLSMGSVAENESSKGAKEEADKALGVTIEARYTVGEYDILILSATQSGGLKQWLAENGYRIPETANEVLDPYIRSNLKFFVVKVNLEEKQAQGVDQLRPIQIRFESPKFMLPIRLGMANSNGEQDMIIYAFTRTGRVECVNYRTVKVPTDRNIPLFVKKGFGNFYKDLFSRAWRREGRNAIFLEYAWNVTPNWGGMKCDPCVGPPPMQQEFLDAGVNWTGGPSGGQAFFTRLHVRYGRDKFPSDLVLQVTPDKEHFQARYIITHPAQGDLSCAEGNNYLEDLYHRRLREMDELAMLTGWQGRHHPNYVKEIRDRLPEERRNDPLPIGGSTKGPGGPPSLLMALMALGATIAAAWYVRAHRPLLRGV